MQRLRVLRAVADHGSFSKAAAALRLTPSAVSQHIAVLERSLGAQVVARSTRGATLTRAGQIMVGAADSVAKAPSTSRSPTTSTARCPPGVRARAPACAGPRSWKTPCTSSCPRGTASPTARHSPSPTWQPNPGSSAASKPRHLRRYADRAGFEPEIRGTTTDYFFARSLVAAGLGIFLAPQRQVARYEGREEIRAGFSRAWKSPHPSPVVGFRDVRVHETADPEVIIAEHEFDAVNHTTGEPFTSGFVLVLRARAGEIVAVRDYADVLRLSAGLGRLPQLFEQLQGAE
ncbi:hypothetical protein ADL22_13240 [Streptomyces sp. NRRL F-4489]|nr:hypothetical protein ADL22_13240 [Streptomyces sp. NRRL F-4489]